MTARFARRLSSLYAHSGALLLAAAVGIFSSWLCAAEPADQRQQLLDLRYKLLQTRAKFDVASWEAREEVPSERLPALLLDDPALAAKLKEAFAKSDAERRQNLQAIASQFDLKNRLKETKDKWWSAAAESLAFQEDVNKAQAVYDFDWQENLPPEFELGWLGWLIVFSWLVLLAVCAALCLHEMRRGLRQSRRIATLVMITAGIASLSNCSILRARGGATRIEDEIAAASRQIEEVNQSYLAAQAKADANREKAMRKWQTLLGDEAGSAFRAQDQLAGEEARELLRDARLAELLSKDARAQIDSLQTGRKKLAALVEQSRSQNIKSRLFRIAGCVVCGLLGFAPLLLVRRRLAKRLKKESSICPRCLAEGTLEAIRARSRDKDGKPISLVECKKCRFQLAASNLKLKRISFPTVGFKSSGKTQWLLTGLDQVSNTQVPVDVMLEAEMEQMSPQIKKLLTMLKQRVPPPPSVYGLPEPLTLILRDSDPWGPTRSLVSMFDFSGEVMDRRIYDDEFRQRALSMDGFMLFLDPTQIEAAAGDIQEALLDRQKDQVTKFYLELCKVRGLEDGDVVRVPVAVCVSKFDLLVNYNPIGEMARKKIAELRKMRSERNLTRELLAKRSELCKGMLPVMFQGWEVDGALRKRFGDNIMYFPMSSVSLIDSELGEIDMKKRALAPFGILEPLLWLLYMQGFCMFED